MSAPTLPPCVLAMRCYCAAHAMGAPTGAPCNADEVSAREEWDDPCEDCGTSWCECDPTPYETPNDPDPGDVMRDSLEDARRYKR